MSTEGANIDVDDLIERYTSGASLYALQHVLSVNRHVLRRLLLERGVPLRGRSAAQQNRMAKMTSDERHANAAAAHTAWRGSSHTDAAVERLAATREAHLTSISPAEAMLANRLRNAGLSCIQQKAVGRYNLDIAVGDVGVEVMGGLWHRSKRHLDRTHYLLDAGWHLVFVWVHGRRYPLGRGATDYLRTFIEESRRNPSGVREYRVIRGGGEEVARGSADMDELPGIPAGR